MADISNPFVVGFSDAPGQVAPETSTAYETSYQSPSTSKSTQDILASFNTQEGQDAYRDVDSVMSLIQTQNPVIVVIGTGDTHNTWLGGRPSIWQGLMAKSVVSEASRSVDQQLFGFELSRHLDNVASQIRDHFQSKNVPVLSFNGGDNRDKGCAIEDQLYMANVGYKPDLIVPGNHDVLSQGIFNSEKNAFGILGVLLGTHDYKKDVWAPSCGGNAPTKVGWTSSIFGWAYGTDLKTVAKTLNVATPQHYKIDGGLLKKWGQEEDAAQVVSDFWHRGFGDNPTDVCIVRLAGAGHNPNDDVISLSVKRQTVTLPDGHVRHLYYLGMDDADYSNGSAAVPGVAPALSWVQSYLFRAYIEDVIRNDPLGEIDASVTHYPLDYSAHPVMGPQKFWEHYLEIFNPFHQSDTPSPIEIPGQNWSFHTHDYRDTLLASALTGFAQPVEDITTTSTLDGFGMTVFIGTEGMDGRIHYQPIKVGIDPGTLNITPRVAAMVKEQSKTLLAYRGAVVDLPDDIRRGLSGLYSDDEQKRNYPAWIKTAFGYEIKGGPFLENVDVLLDLTHVTSLHFESLFSRIECVTNLLPDGDPRRTALSLQLKYLRDYYFEDWKPKFEAFQKEYTDTKTSHKGNRPTGKMKEKMVKELQTLLDLPNYKVGNDDEAVITKIEFLLRPNQTADSNMDPIPLGSEADTFMTIMAVLGGEAEQAIPFQVTPPTTKMATGEKKKTVPYGSFGGAAK